MALFSGRFSAPYGAAVSRGTLRPGPPASSSSPCRRVVASRSHANLSRNRRSWQRGETRLIRPVRNRTCRFARAIALFQPTVPSSYRPLWAPHNSPTSPFSNISTAFTHYSTTTCHVPTLSRPYMVRIHASCATDVLNYVAVLPVSSNMVTSPRSISPLVRTEDNTTASENTNP